MKANRIAFAAIAAIVLVALLVSMVAGPSAGVAAPATAPTPVAAGKAASGVTPVVVTLLDAMATVDDVVGPCVYVGDYEKADIYYSVTVNGSNVNTTTLTLQHGNTTGALVDGLNVAATVVTDTTGLNQFALYGAYLCVKIDATDAATGTVTVSADALLK